MSRDDRHTAGSDSKAGESRDAPPPLYRVLMLDDGGAPHGVIESLLESVFRMTPVDAGRAAGAVQAGQPVECGIYRYEIAETKASEAIEAAAAHRVDLQMTLEPV